MCLTSSPSAPKQLPVAPGPIQSQDTAGQQAAEAERKRRASAQGYQSTILSQPLGSTGGTSSNQPKTVLGG